jgi:carboxymethylenebutenolidase
MQATPVASPVLLGQATVRTLPDLGAIFDDHALTGGARAPTPCRAFYSSQFLGHTPADAVLDPIARTLSPERVIDEFIFTHDSELPWMLPGIAPTGRRVRIPMVMVMGFEGDKVAYERIYWDQASALVQVGVLEAADAPGSAADQADRLLEHAAKT